MIIKLLQILLSFQLNIGYLSWKSKLHPQSKHPQRDVTCILGLISAIKQKLSNLGYYNIAHFCLR